MLPWGLLLGFISAVIVGVLMGMLADWLQGEHSRKLGLPRARDPHRMPVRRS